MKILTILGARPQFVKAAVLSRQLKTIPSIQEIIVHTGQHFDEKMSDVFFEEMEIPKPQHFLNINSLSHGAMTGRMMEKIEEILLLEKPDLTLVYGDTNSTLAGALAASKLGIKVAHVEAGLRSFNMAMPEEINRILTDRISNLLFCPSEQSILNLQKEGFPFKGSKIVKTGDIMLDAAMYYQAQSSKKAKIFQSPPKEDFALATIHRQESTDDGEKLRSIFKALDLLNKDLKVILPLHPRTQKKLDEFSIKTDIEIISPVGYFDMIQLLSHCKLVVTDSGGLQKEAFFFKKPCVTLREETEWVELIVHGVNVLAGSGTEKIISATNKVLNQKMNFDINLYGDGNTGKQIVKELELYP